MDGQARDVKKYKWLFFAILPVYCSCYTRVVATGLHFVAPFCYFSLCLSVSSLCSSSSWFSDFCNNLIRSCVDNLPHFFVFFYFCRQSAHVWACEFSLSINTKKLLVRHSKIVNDPVGEKLVLLRQLTCCWRWCFIPISWYSCTSFSTVYVRVAWQTIASNILSFQKADRCWFRLLRHRSYAQHRSLACSLKMANDVSRTCSYG